MSNLMHCKECGCDYAESIEEHRKRYHSRPFVGQIVQYRYRPDSEPQAAIVAMVHDQKWVALHVFSELQRWIPQVCFAEQCRPVPHAT